MFVKIEAPWQTSEEKAKQDLQFLKFKFFTFDHNFGIESVKLCDGREYRATVSVELDNFNIIRTS